MTTLSETRPDDVDKVIANLCAVLDENNQLALLPAIVEEVKELVKVQERKHNQFGAQANPEEIERLNHEAKKDEQPGN